MPNETDVLLGILLDKASQQQTERGLEDIEKKIGGIDKVVSQAADSMGDSWDQMGQDFDKFTTIFNSRFKRINGQLIDTVTGVKATESALRKFSSVDVNASAESMEKTAEDAKIIAEELKKAEQADKALNREIRKVSELGNLSEELTRDLPEDIYQAGVNASNLEENLHGVRSEVAILNQASAGLNRLFAPLAAGGTAIVGAIALSARQYTQFIESSGIKGDETATRWVAATKRVQNASLNLGEKSAEAILPIYEKAADLAEKAAAFVDKNPDLVQAALNTGLVVATLGAVGVAVAKGIKIYADLKYLAATTEYTLATARFQASVREFLAGSTLGVPGEATPVSGGGSGAAGVLGKISLVTIGVVIAKALVDAVSAGLAQTDFGKQIDDAQKEAAAGGGGYPGINRYAREVEKADQASEDAAESASDLAGGLRDFNQEATLARATESFIQFRQQEAQAEKQYMAQRAQIVEQGAKQLASIEENYQNQRARLISQFAQSSAAALANFNRSRQRAEENFARSDSQAVQDFNKSQSKAREDYQEQEQRSREDHLREMRRLEEDHNDRVRDLVASRDALGLVREKRDFERSKREAEEEFRTQRARRRQDFQRQEQDRREEFQAQRARRRQEFELQQQQAAEDFALQQEQARKQFEERLQDLDNQHRIEVEKTRQQTQERLRDLELAFREEQITRRNAFFDILRDLDANLLNERDIRNQYYARMQADLESFLSSAAGAAGSNLPQYQKGGYAPAGAIRTHSGEYVLDPASTRALEGLVGGKISRESIQSLAMGGGSNTINMSFPGGMLTAEVLAKELDQRDSQLIRKLTKGLVRA